MVVTCRVLDIARQPYYRWLQEPVTDAEIVEAYRTNALVDAHRDDPEFGYRFLVDEARAAGQPMAERTAWRICSNNGLWSVFGKKRGRNGKRPGPPVHDDLVGRDFTADAPNHLWLADITEHRTEQGKLYCCAIKDVFSNRIVGYSIADRMNRSWPLPRCATRSPAAAMSPAVCCTPTAGRNFEAGNSLPHCTTTTWSAPWAGSAPPVTTPPWSRSSACCRRTSWTGTAGPPAKTYGSRLSPGSNAPTTVAGARSPWAG